MTFNTKNYTCSKCKGTLEYGGVFEDGIGYLCTDCFTTANGLITPKSNLFKAPNDDEFTTIKHIFSNPGGIDEDHKKSLEKLIEKLKE